MKKIILGIFLFTIFMINSYADSGKLNSSSIVSCNNITYGSHGKDNHWHEAKLNENNSYYAKKDIIGYINPCNDINKTKVLLSKCIDGDTAKFLIDEEIVTFRFLAIDTPEINKKDTYGDIASKYTCDKLNNAKDIKIEYDEKSSVQDKYGRSLAWIWVDNILLQDELVKNGLAKVAYLYGEYSYVEQLKNSELIAKQKELNIWANKELVSSEKPETKNNNNGEIIGEAIIILLAIILTLLKKNKR